MGLFDSAKDFIKETKNKAAEALGDEGVEALKNLKDSAVKAGGQVKSAAVDTWNTSDNEIICKAREFTAGAKQAIQENAGKTEVRVKTVNGAGPGLVPAVCTQCGATLTVDPSKDAAVCQYCGTAFIVANAINQYKIAHADIHADKVEVHTKSKTEAALDYMKERQKVRAEEKRAKAEADRKRLIKILPIYVVVMVVVFVMIFVMNNKREKEATAEEVALQQTVEEVQTLINEGRYDEALVKANGVVFTTYTGETKRKWDNTRRALIDTIETKMEEVELAAEAEAAAAAEVVPAAPKKETQKTSEKSVSYSTNSSSTVKEGNRGVYSYKSRGGSYEIYYIIDFDEGYVYRFIDGNGEGSCDRVKIVQGDLNSTVIITYHDGGDTWSNGLHFKFARQPDHLIVEDQDGYEDDYYSTDLENAISIRDSKKIVDY